jgi:hypothetical protein
MKRFLIVAFPSFLLGAIAGAAFWYLASPLWIDRVVNEDLARGADAMVVAEGRFRDADAVHRGQGLARVVALASGGVEVQLSEFSVTNGPDLELWLSDHPDPSTAADVTGGQWLSLGLLKGNIGDQRYSVPAGTDLSRYRSVVVWCEQFGVLFSPAPLGAGG